MNQEKKICGSPKRNVKFKNELQDNHSLTTDLENNQSRVIPRELPEISSQKKVHQVNKLSDLLNIWEKVLRGVGQIS